MLTVWRSLHIEVDSMDNVSGNSVTGNIATSVKNNTSSEVTLTLNVSPSLEPNRFENGRLVIGGTASYTVYGNTGNTVTIFNNLGLFNVRYATPFTLYDDFNSNDGTNKHGDEGEPLPLLNQDFLKDNDTAPAGITTPDSSALAPAYIRPKYDLAGGREKDAPFLVNIPMDTPQSVRDALHFDNVLLNAREDFWTVNLLSGYQYVLSQDGDPIDETNAGNRTMGASDGQKGKGSIVFLEVHSPHECFEDAVVCDVAATKVHEIGHLLNADHNQGGVMDNVSINFSEVSLNLIRKIEHP